MIDLHNHVLPGVDDGARDLNQALRMLEIAAGEGITHVACTPHGNDNSDEKTGLLYQSVFAKLQEAAGQRKLPVELMLGCELMLGANILRVMKLPFATYDGKSKYALVEFPVETPFEIILNVVKSIRRNGPRPVLAHFERFARAQRTAEHVQQMRNEGAVITLDAGSLGGQFGPVMEKRSKQLLEWNVVDILASDAHDDADHGFRLAAGRDAAAKLIGEEAAAWLVLDNPRRVWEGEPWPEPEHENRVQ